MLSHLPSYVEFDRIWSIKILECDDLALNSEDFGKENSP